MKYNESDDLPNDRPMSENTIKIKPCPICEDSSSITELDCKLMLHKCHTCNHIFTPLEKDQQESYDGDYFIRTHRNWFENPNYELFDFLYKHIDKSTQCEDLRLLDVGCGNGNFLKYVLEKNSTMPLVGLDLIDNNHPGITFIKGDLYEYEFNEKFDVVVSLAVVEHVDDPNLYIQKLSNVLKDGGMLYLMTINSSSLFYKIAALLKTLGIRIAYDRVYQHHHLQHYNNESLRKLLERNSYEVLLQKNTGYPLKCVDVPEGSFLIQALYKLVVFVIFTLADLFHAGIMQSMACRKKSK